MKSKGTTTRSLNVPTPQGHEPARQISSEQLLGPVGELVIVHAGRQYRLRITQNGKLILTA